MNIIEQIERAVAKAQLEAEALRDARAADRRAPKAKTRATKIRRLEEAERSARCDVRIAKAARAEQARCAKKGGSKAGKAPRRRSAAPPAPPRGPLALTSGPRPIGFLPPPLPRRKVGKVKKTAGKRLAATAKQRAARAAALPKPIAARGPAPGPKQAAKRRPRTTSAAAPRRDTFKIKTSTGFAERTGYVLGDWATHKEPGKGQYFWGITHLPTGYKVTASPVLENKTQAIARIVEYHTKGPPDVQASIIKDIQTEAAELEAEREKARKIAAQVGDVGGRVAVLGRIRRGRKKSWGVRFQMLPMHVEHLDRDEFFHPVEAFPPPTPASAPKLLPPPLPRRKVAQVRKARGGGRLRPSPKQRAAVARTPRSASGQTRASAVVADFEERRSQRAERLSTRAARLAQEGAAKVERAREMAGVIPFGQPILVGHHSERRDRRYREKIHETFRAGYETTKAAEELARRAAAAEENRAISSDDPAAIEKLKAKLAAEEAEHALHVKGNAIIRKHGKDVGGAARAMLALGIKPSQVQRAMMSFGNLDTPSGFFTQNSAANIRRIKERIKELTQHRTAPAAGPETIGEIEIFEEDNRTKMRFPGKPSAEIRDRLKSAGFRWSPTTGTWQRMSSNQALYHAREIARAASQEK